MAKQPENVVQGNIVLFLREFGWSVIPTNSAAKSAPGMKGFPDLFCFKGELYFLVEVKVKGKKLRETQFKWLEKHMPNLRGNRRWHHTVTDSFEDFRQWFMRFLPNSERSNLMVSYKPTYRKDEL